MITRRAAFIGGSQALMVPLIGHTQSAEKLTLVNAHHTS
jgi:hypothetical protein